jgi:cystathionine gamma-synthase
MKNNYSSQTIAVQLGGATCVQTQGIVPPIYVSSTYRRDPFNQTPGVPIYARCDNANYPPVEAVIAKLEAGDDALLFSSGMAAAATVVLSLPQASRILVPKRFYAGIWEWLTTHVSDLGYELAFADYTNLEEVRHTLASTPCALVWLETPTTPGLDIVPILQFAEISRQHSAVLLVDNTAATPVLTMPIKLGADLVLHSATKALNGHDDIIAGALVAARSDELWERIKFMTQ